MVNQLSNWLKKAGHLLHELYYAPYRGTLLREARQEDDMLRLLVFADMLGIPNPMLAYNLEVQILMLQDFHDWHRRLGLKRSPFDHISCC